MLPVDSARIAFFGSLFKKHGTKRLLDCSCGTGSDLLMFRSLLDNVYGSDLSDAMLAVAHDKIRNAGANIPLTKANFCHLESYGLKNFDAVVCLSSSFGEVHSDEDAVTALKSMYASLNTNGILIIDQGQSDAMMQAKPRFIPVLNTCDLSRLFVIDYPVGSDDFITVNICDLLHTSKETSFSVSPFTLRVRLVHTWQNLLKRAGIARYKIFGNWDMSAYDTMSSRRIIITAVRE